MVAGANGLANFTGELTYKGTLAEVNGTVKLAAQRSRMATIYADRTRLVGDYHLGYRAGTFGLAGDYAADSANLDPSMLAGVTQPLAAAAKTPLGPVAGAIGKRFCAPRPISTPPAKSAWSISRAAERRASRPPTSSAGRSAGARLRRQRSDLLLALGRPQDRRRHRNGRRRASAAGG